jgi:hypothetical protein
MPKSVSIHGSACEFECPHAAVCYHRKKDKVPIGSFNISNIVDDILDNKEYSIYMSVCSASDYVRGIYLLNNFNNVNITIPVGLLNNKQLNYVNCDCLDNSDRIQVTVSTMADIVLVGNKIQKLFLIKDDESFSTAVDILKHGHIDNIHFPIEQEYIKLSKLLTLIGAWRDCKNTTISLDSCLENFVVHGKCVYLDDYVDINYDGTYRKCPFKKTGKIIRDSDTVESMINDNDEVDCIYSKLFGGRV